MAMHAAVLNVIKNKIDKYAHFAKKKYNIQLRDKIRNSNTKLTKMKTKLIKLWNKIKLADAWISLISKTLNQALDPIVHRKKLKTLKIMIFILKKKGKEEI